MKTSRLRPVLYRRNARGEEFLQLPRGFWAPLAWLLGVPHLAQAARTLLQAGLPRRFAVRCDCLGHARDASARLLPLVLYRDALDLAPLVRRCADPEALGAYVRGRLAEFSPGEAAAERQVLVCQALPDLCEASAALQPVPPVACPLPVLVQHRARPALNAGAIEALESTAGPVVVLLAARGGARVKYDWAAMVLCFLLTGGALCLYAAAWMLLHVPDWYLYW